MWRPTRLASGSRVSMSAAMSSAGVSMKPAASGSQASSDSTSCRSAGRRRKRRRAAPLGQDRPVQRLAVDLLNPLPAFATHAGLVSHPRSPWRSTRRVAARLSSRNSHTFAICHSRITVFVETPNASAVSSWLSPPKNRISTTRLLRSSMVASALSASSRATRSDRARSPGLFVERDVLGPTAAFAVLACAGEVDQDATHQPRRQGKEMGAVLPLDLRASTSRR